METSLAQNKNENKKRNINAIITKAMSYQAMACINCTLYTPKRCNKKKKEKNEINVI